MAASVKYTGTFRNRYNKAVSVFLLADGVFTIKEITFADDPVVISYDGADDDMFQTMIPSKATINAMIGIDDVDFLEDINAMTENTFGVLITVREPSSPFTLLYKWEGWLVPDEQTRKFTYQSQPITLTAIDPISRTKGRILMNANGSFLYGKKTIKYIVDQCLQGVFTPDTTTAVYNLVVDSDMTISNTTSTTLPPIFEQLLVNTEAFNDDMGRAKSSFDVLEMIAKALFMRVFYENGNVYFVDILQYSLMSTSPGLTLNNLRIPTPSIAEGTNTLLINNSENITRVRTYRESICKFTYRASIGLLFDGNLTNWQAAVGGFRLAQWYYSPYLNIRPDVNARRQGTGRAESPYGMLIRYTAQLTDPFNAQHRFFDVISSKSSQLAFEGDLFSLSLRVNVPNAKNVNTSIPYMDGSVPLVIPYYVIAFNQNDPAKSYYLDSAAWKEKDLSGTDFATLGTPDWIAIFGAYDDSLNGNAPDSILYRPLHDLEETGGYSLFAVERTDKDQEFNRDFPGLPNGFKGELYVFIHPAINSGADNFSNPGFPNSNITNTIVFSCILTQKVAATGSGEIQYLSRKIVTSQDNVTREVDFNTTVNRSTAGAIANAVPYVESGVTIPALTNLNTISLKDYPEPLYSGVSLMEYNAIGQMWLNYAQYKIDLTTMGLSNNFADGVYLGDLYDASKPSTEIYQNVFMQMKSTYNLKESTRDITVVSTKAAQRIISEPPAGQIDDTHDFSEFYYIK